MLFSHRGIGTLSSSTHKSVPTGRPNSITPGAAVALRDHGMALIDLIGAAHHLSANGLRNTRRISITLPSAVATPVAIGRAMVTQEESQEHAR